MILIPLCDLLTTSWLRTYMMRKAENKSLQTQEGANKLYEPSAGKSPCMHHLTHAITVDTYSVFHGFVTSLLGMPGPSSCEHLKKRSQSRSMVVELYRLKHNLQSVCQYLLAFLSEQGSRTRTSTSTEPPSRILNVVRCRSRPLSPAQPSATPSGSGNLTPRPHTTRSLQ